MWLIALLANHDRITLWADCANHTWLLVEINFILTDLLSAAAVLVCSFCLISMSPMPGWKIKSAQSDWCNAINLSPFFLQLHSLPLLLVFFSLAHLMRACPIFRPVDGFSNLFLQDGSYEVVLSRLVTSGSMIVTMTTAWFASSHSPPSDSTDAGLTDRLRFIRRLLLALCLRERSQTSTL